MSRFSIGLLAIILALVWTYASRAVERFPPPDFTSHQLPETPQPPPPAPWWETIDVVLLVTALVLATYFALAKRSRNATLVLTGFSLFWFGFHRQGCVCPIGAIQDVAQGLFDSAHAIPWSILVFFSLPLVFALFFGRVFCAAVCPLGAIQEIAAIRPHKLPDWLEQMLGLFPWVYLGLAVLYAATGTAYVICEYDPFVAFFRRSGATSMLVFGGALLAIGIFVGRPYCRFLCPYGVILGLFAKLARWHVRIPPTECIRCRLCEDACPYNAIVAPVPPLTRSERAPARRRLLLAMAVLPIWLALGGGIGYALHPIMAQLDPQVRLARWVRSKNIDPNNKFAVDAVTAFHNTGASEASLYQAAAERLRKFGVGSAIFGLWVGLVFGLKWVHTSTRPSRQEYLPDPRRCVACGRCFWYCPVEQVRRGWIIEDELLQLPKERAPLVSSVANDE
ncbi:MAG: 4Fe-4S binding protein [Thermogutta sp.]|nr:4Fe-4S binding protein [Thermogutta sp.]HOP76121.1 4Fe-4S binding protein [Thermogutta sp.]HPU05597.1 4Fe-4S binding protein [Thermogutta sp.]